MNKCSLWRGSGKRRLRSSSRTTVAFDGSRACDETAVLSPRMVGTRPGRSRRGLQWPAGLLRRGGNDLEVEIAVVRAVADGAVEADLDCDLVARPYAASLSLEDLESRALVTDGEVVADGACEGLGEETIEIDTFGELAMDVARLGRLDGEAFVPERDVDVLEELVGLIERRDVADSQLFDESVL